MLNLLIDTGRVGIGDVVDKLSASFTTIHVTEASLENGEENDDDADANVETRTENQIWSMMVKILRINQCCMTEIASELKADTTLDLKVLQTWFAVENSGLNLEAILLDRGLAKKI